MNKVEVQMENKTDNVMKDLLDYDGLAEAERLTGKHSGQDDGTAWLGMGLMQINNKIKNAKLKEMGDTVFSMSTEDYIAVIEEYGFEKVLEDSELSADTRKGETQFVYFHKKHSLLLEFDTYHGSRNGGEVFYNCLVKHSELGSFYNYTSSGGFVFCGDVIAFYKRMGDINQTLKCANETLNIPSDPKWGPNKTMNERSKQFDNVREQRRKIAEKNDLYVIHEGSRDCREGIVFSLNQLRKHSTFIKHKKFNNSIIINLHDHKSDREWNDKDSVGWKRFLSLPKYVQEAVGYSEG